MGSIYIIVLYEVVWWFGVLDGDVRRERRIAKPRMGDEITRRASRSMICGRTDVKLKRR